MIFLIATFAGNIICSRIMVQSPLISPDEKRRSHHLGATYLERVHFEGGIPLKWNTFNQATKWFSEKTKKDWTPGRIVNFAID